MSREKKKHETPKEDEQEQARPSLFLISGTLDDLTKDGKPKSVSFWALVEVPADKADSFVNAYEQAHYSDAQLELEAYVSALIDSAKGEKKPSREKMKEMEETYGDRLNVLQTDDPGGRSVIPVSPANDI